MKRKNVILFALFLMFSTGLLWAQSEALAEKAKLPYKPMAMFEGDTVAYLEFNYLIRNIQYVGWTVGDILKEIELLVFYITDRQLRHADDGRSIKLMGLCFALRPFPYGKGEDWISMNEYYIKVRFETPPDLEEYCRYAGKNDQVLFTPKLYDYIKDLRVIGVAFSDLYYFRHDPKDPDLLERMKQIKEENERRVREDVEKRENK